MSSSCLRKSTRMVAGLVTGLLFAMLAVPLGAQAVPESRAARGSNSTYDATHEITLHGTIQEVVTKHATGSPAGMHLLVPGPEGVIDAHIGSLLSKETIGALQTGAPVEIVGATVLLNGKEYLLARQLTVDGRTVAIRSSRGVLLHSNGTRTASMRKAGYRETNGGAR